MTALLLALLAMSADGWFSVMVPEVSRADLSYLSRQGFDIEAVFVDRARVYVNEDRMTMLRGLGYSPVALDEPVPLVPYPSLTEVNTTLANIVSQHSSICRLENIGTSYQGRPIYAVVVSQNISQNEAEPRVRVCGNIHGDEKGSGMSVLNFLTVLTDNYGTSDMCTYLVNNAETWIIPVQASIVSGWDAGTIGTAPGGRTWEKGRGSPREVACTPSPKVISPNYLGIQLPYAKH